MSPDQPHPPLATPAWSLRRELPDLFSTFATARSDQPHSDGKPPQRTSRRGPLIRRAALIALVAFLLFLAAAVPIALGMLRRAPSWWRSIDPQSPRTIAVATDLENQIVDIMSEVRPTARDYTPTTPSAWQSDPWTIAVRAADANAWINARLPKWVANHGKAFAWPRQIEQVQVEFARGLIHIGARVRDDATTPPTTRILSAALQPTLAADGSLWMRADTLSVGSLPLPTSLILASAKDSDALPKQLPDLPETEMILKAFAGLAPLTVTPALTLGDGRRVRILAVSPQDGQLIITCRTERK